MMVEIQEDLVLTLLYGNWISNLDVAVDSVTPAVDCAALKEYEIQMLIQQLDLNEN
jgi:hypothetical protein